MLDAPVGQKLKPAVLALAVLITLVALAPTADAQVVVAPQVGVAAGTGGRVPPPMYFNALPGLYDGQYRDALRNMLQQSRNGIKSANRQWIDAIPSLTMAGECYYQMGQLDAALEQYDAALKLYVAYSDWMLRVQFPQVIAPAANPVRATPWGQSKRGAGVGAFPDSFTMSQGQVDQSANIRNGGVIQAPVMFPVHAAEIVRCTCLAMRRRSELMGPVCKFDPLTSNLVDVLSRNPGPPNHWSQSWINVQMGCAYAAAGSLPQAKTALERGVLVGGQFDHPLTSTALVELARISLAAGDYKAALDYAGEASFACANFPDSSNLEESFRIGLVSHLLLNQQGPYPPLAPAVAWSKAQGPRYLHVSLLLLSAENMAVGGDASQAANYLSTARLAMARSNLGDSRLGAQLQYLNALVSYQEGRVPAGDQALASALGYQRKGSLWAYQIALADTLYMSGNASDRVAGQLYADVLREPAAADWAVQPLECLSVLQLPHGSALEHWFELVMKDGKDQELALEVADRARRHRFFGTLPMGGRLLALRWILEGPVDLLGQQGLLERQDLLARYPRYAQLSKQAADLRQQLAAKPVAADAADARRAQTEQLASLATISQAQEVILREIALRREPADMVFPPLRQTKDIQHSLAQGQVLLAFFATRTNLYAFLFSHDRYAAWRVASPTLLERQVAQLLRDMGNFESNHELSAAELSKANWQASGGKVLQLLLAGSNVDLAGNFDEIVIVPDGFLWYLPFEVLSVGPPEHQRPLLSHARVRYAPTAGLAVPYGRAQKPRPNVGVALGKLHPQDDDSVTADAFRRLAPAVAGAFEVPRALPAHADVYRVLLDGLIVLDDIEPADGPYQWAPLQFDRQPTTAALASWFSLPFGGPENLILPGFHTAAESGIRKGRPGGDELFLSVCGLMASGARTILISRWRTSGQTCFELLREFAQELPYTSPAAAWQRSVQLASAMPLEADREPRVKQAAGAAPLPASHPLFWAGYMLVDSGVLAANEDGVLELPGKADPAARPQPANPPLNAAK